MRSPDFLHKHAETPLCENYTAAGVVCSLSTNCDLILEAARGSFLPAEATSGSADFSLRFWVDDTDIAPPPWPKPYVRGLDHLVFAGFDSRSSLLADLRTRRVIGRFSAAMATDTAHWKMVIFPMLLSIVAGSVGLVELHASCVARDDHGLILMGPSCSGKSTLAMALTETGFRFLSDDRVFCSLKAGRFLAWGLPRPLKLRREAQSWFEDLRNREPSDIQNGERVFYCEPNQPNGQRHNPQCEPQSLVFLERRPGVGFSMTPLGCSEVRSRIEKELLAEDPEAAHKQAETLDGLLGLPCYTLQYGGRPQVIAAQLAASFLNSKCQ